MTNFVGRLGVTLGLDSAEFTKGIEAAGRKLEQFANTAATYGKVGAAALTAAGAAALRYADDLADVAQANEVAIASVLQLSNALAKNGGKAEDTSKLLTSFANAIDKAAAGSFETQKSLQSLGVGFKDLGTLDIEQLLRKTIEGLAEMPDSLTRAARATDLFGKAGKGVDFVGLNEEMKTSNRLTEEQGSRIKAAADAYDMLSEAARTVTTVLASELGPPLKTTLEYIKTIKSESDGMGSALKTAFETITVLGANLVFVFQAIVSEMEHTINNAKLLATLDLKGARAANEEHWAKWEKRKAELEAFEKKVMGANAAATTPAAAEATQTSAAAAGGQVRNTKLAVDKDAEAERKRILDNWAKGYLAVQQQIEEGQKLNAELASEMQRKELEFLEKRKIEREQALKREADEIEEGRRLLAEQATEYQKANAALVERQKLEAVSIERQKIMLDLADKGMLMRASEYQFAQEVLSIQFKYEDAAKEIRANEMLSFDEKEEALLRLKALTEAEFDLAKQRLALADKFKNASFGEGFTVAMVQAARNATTAFDFGRQAFDSMIGSMDSALKQFVQTGKITFKDLTKSIIQDLIAIQLRAQATALFSRMIGGFFQGSTVGPGMASQALPAGFNQYLAGARAEGGPVSGNSPYLVGERGPELFVPRSSGAIVPNHQLAGMMGGGQVINYNGPFIQQMSAIDTQSGIQFLTQNKQAVWAANQSAQRSLPMSR